MMSPNIKKTGIVGVDFGKDVTVVEPVNLYGCRIGDGTFVGPFVEIQRNAVIGKNCKIQSHAFICELVEIGDNCVISHGVMFINDLFKTGKPAFRDKTLWKETRIGSNVLIGSNSTILPVNIVDGVVVGAGSVVTKDLTVKGIYAGNPAKLLRKI
ncbi:MAG: UDP-3-O-(3-hydroxymyristoyl)glucosamine N-acyltransferase [Lentisphaerae bacterium GWF2_49_21]|nr:MAG: UDP-3-O-(3-hydroxymyristoyl)glucosamine N-acyltransferase [Lentisphaerae bacterium GWF2_49_21]